MQCQHYVDYMYVECARLTLCRLGLLCKQRVIEQRFAIVKPNEVFENKHLLTNITYVFTFIFQSYFLLQTLLLNVLLNVHLKQYRFTRWNF